jgi:hypothetical protein
MDIEQTGISSLVSILNRVYTYSKMAFEKRNTKKLRRYSYE